jgi:peptide/nickel transport system substrate-binding protein
MKRLIGICLVALAAAGCPGETPTTPPIARGAPVRGGTAVIGELGDVLTWNPYLAEDQTTEEILSLVYPSLAIEQVDYRLHPPSFEPHLATSWSWSEDRLELVFHLDERAVWTDGVPVTAGDVVFSWRTQISPELGWPIAGAKDFIESVEAVDPHTVRFRFSRSYPYQLMDANEGLVIPAHAWSEIPYGQWRDTDWSGRVVSAGPFRRASHRPQQELVLERNDQYWKPGLPRLDRVVWRPVPSKTSLLTQLLTGDIDVLNGVPPADANRVRRDPRLGLVLFPDRGYSQIRWNLRRPPFDDAEVRRALTLAIDREMIVDVVYEGFGRVATGPILSGMWAFNRELEPLPHDPVAARRLLGEAGWADSDGDGVLDRAGRSFTFELLTNAENELRQDICILVEDSLARLGIRVTPRFVEWGTLLSLEQRGEFDAIVSRWIEPTLIDLDDLWHSASPREPTMNTGGYTNPEVDRLLAEVSDATDFAEQKPLLDRIQELIVADQPYTFLVETVRLVGVNGRIQGADINDATPYFNLEEWWVADASEDESGSP